MQQVFKQIEISKEKIKQGLEVLKEIQKTFPDAILAGGYLRDAVMQGKPKDIDIFIPYTEESVVESTVKVWRASELLGARYMPQQEVSRVWDTSTYDVLQESSKLDYDDLIASIQSELQVQIIMLQKGMTVESRINGYDFGICQIFTKGEEVFCTQEFLDDVNNKTCTLLVCEDETQFKRSMRRFERFKKKYFGLNLKIRPDVEYLKEFKELMVMQEAPSLSELREKFKDFPEISGICRKG